MANEQIIEAIVKEVKRVLAQRGIEVAPASPEKTTSAKVTPPRAGVSRKSPLPASPAEIGSRDLTGRQVITQKDFEGFSGSSVTVTRRAVITPLAIDYAREKGIVINRVDAPAGAAQAGVPSPDAVTAGLVVARNFPSDGTVVTKILSAKKFAVREFTGEYEQAIKQLAEAVGSGAVQFGICVEKSGMEGPIYANRNSRVSAVHCRTTIEARAARVDYNANIVVIDSGSSPEAVIAGYTGM